MEGGGIGRLEEEDEHTLKRGCLTLHLKNEKKGKYGC